MGFNKNKGWMRWNQVFTDYYFVQNFSIEDKNSDLLYFKICHLNFFFPVRKRSFWWSVTPHSSQMCSGSSTRLRALRPGVGNENSSRVNRNDNRSSLVMVYFSLRLGGRRRHLVVGSEFWGGESDGRLSRGRPADGSEKIFRSLSCNRNCVNN